MTLRCGCVRAMCSAIGSTVVMPAPALANRSGPSDGCTTLAGRRADLEHVVDPGVVEQETRHTTVRGHRRAFDPAHGDLQPRARGRRGDGVLPRLAVTVGKVDEDR